MALKVFFFLAFFLSPAFAGELREYCRPDQIPLPAAPSAPSVEAKFKDLLFATTKKKDLKLDLYLPGGVEGLIPVVVYIHGGAWVSGNKLNCPHLSINAAGFAAACISYRFSQENFFPAQIHDVKAAVRWLRANAETYKLNPRRIGAWGSSAGGHLAALLGTSDGVHELEGSVGITNQKSCVQAVADWYGPTDFFQLSREHFCTGNPRSSFCTSSVRNGSPEAKLVACLYSLDKKFESLFNCAKRVAQASPVTYISGNSPPFFIQHGETDNTVSPASSQLLHRELLRNGARSTLEILPKSGHGDGLFQERATKRAVMEFFRANM